MRYDFLRADRRRARATHVQPGQPNSTQVEAEHADGVAFGNVGFGGKQHVDVHHFNGWAEFQHQSIDLGAAYGYEFALWGKLTATYAHRVFAHNFPERVNFFTLTYSLPFSYF